MARAFGGADIIQFSVGGLVGIGSSGHSLWAICRRSADGSWHTPISIETSGGSSKLAMQFSDTNRIQLIIGSSNKDTTVAINSSDGWVLAGVSRASGSSVPRGHKYVYSSNTWTHTDAGAATGGDSTDLTGGRVQIGQWQNTDRFNGDILKVGAAKRALADAEWELLPFTLLASLGMAPDGLWLLDQSATSQAVADLTGLGANQTSLTNTSVSTNSPPVWNYGAGGLIVVGQAGGAADAAATPAAVAATASLPPATISAGSTEMPAAIAAAAALPAASVSAGSTRTPAAITAAAAVPSAAISAGSTATPAAAAAVVAFPAATVSAGSATAPAAVAAVVALPSALVSASATVTPGVIACEATLLQPTVDTAGNATVTPALIAAVVQVHSVTVSAGARTAPATVAATVAVPQVPFGAATVKATSVASVSARRTSITAVLARRTSTAAVTASTTSSGGVS